MIVPKSQTPPALKRETFKRSEFAASKMTVLGLDGIRSRMGDRWGKTSEKVHTFFTALLQREMRPGDTFHKLDELSYLVIFRDLSAADAQGKCLAIAETVSRRLFGEETGTVSIRSVIGAFGGDLLLENTDARSAVEAALEAEGMETISTSDGGDVSHHTPAPVTEPSDAHVAKAARLNVTFGPDHADLETLLETQFAFKYRPIWDTGRKVVLTYLCQPTPGTQSNILAATSLAYGLCVSAEPSESYRLDLLVLEEVVKRVESLRKAGFRILLACPVHFMTVAQSRSWTEYLRRLQHVRADLLRDIVFLIMGIDRGIPSIRLAQEIPKLTTHAKFVFAAIEYSEGMVPRFANTGIHAIGVELRQSRESERQLLFNVDALARDAHAIRIESFVLGAKTRSAVVSAIASGVRYLEGPAISLPVDQPQHAFVHKITDLYRGISTG